MTPCPGPANNCAPSTDKSKNTPPGFKSIPVARKLTFGSETPVESPSGDSGHSIADGFTNKTKVKENGVSHMVNDSSVGSYPSNQSDYLPSLPTSTYFDVIYMISITYTLLLRSLEGVYNSSDRDAAITNVHRSV